MDTNSAVVWPWGARHLEKVRARKAAERLSGDATEPNEKNWIIKIESYWKIALWF